ncbi:MAG TPA: 2OG-Fe(II) oxygenase [Caulobacteraceae bacterium]
MSGPAAPHLLTDDFLSPDERADLLRWALDNRGRFQPAQVREGGVRPEGRDAMCLRDLGPLTDLLRDRALAHHAAWVEKLRVTRFMPDVIELELAAHNHGSHFTIHSDTYPGDQPAIGDRMLSAVYYFHEEPKRFSGGALRLHHLGARAGDAGQDISPDGGRLVVFPSWWPHEVTRVTCESRAFEDSRFSLNCWLHRARRS